MAKGRPPKVHVNDILAAVDPYLNEADPPILAEFAHLNGITRQYLYELSATLYAKGDRRLSDAIKRISEEKEIRLERGGLSGHYAPSVAVFSLKQLGWTDKPVVVPENNTDVKEDALTAAIKDVAAEMEADKNAAVE